MTDFPQKLKIIRQTKRITQKQLAEKTHISRSSIAMYETGKTVPSQETLKHIAECLGVSVEHFMR